MNNTQKHNEYCFKVSEYFYDTYIFSRFTERLSLIRDGA